MTDYEADISNWKNENIDSEDKAISLLLGLKPEPWLRYLNFCKVHATDDWEKLSEEDQKQKEFIEEYSNFLETTDSFSFIPKVSRYSTFRRWFEEIKKRGEWKGDFSSYVQTLYDDGVLFRPDIVNFFKLEHSPDSWVSKLYKNWTNKSGWTLEEAVCLFIQVNPTAVEKERKEKQTASLSREKRKELYQSLIDTRQYNYKIEHSELEDLLKRDVAKGEIKRLEDNYYDPKKIVEWLIRNAPYTPPPILLSLLNIKNVDVLKAQKKQRQGRPEGSGCVLGDDERVDHMQTLIVSKKAKSTNDAAIQTFREFGKSGASESADIRRLTRKYNKKFLDTK